MTSILYHHPLACSLAAVITASEGAVDVEVKITNIFTKEIQGGGSLFDINPLGQVPTLVTDHGDVLTENTAVLMWIQDHATNSAFKREPGSAEYYQIIRWLGFCGTEMHKSVIWPIMNKVAESEQENARDRGRERLTFLNAHLSNRDYLVGESISAADAYLFWILNISEFADIDITPFSYLSAYKSQLFAREIFAKARKDDDETAAEMTKTITNWTPVKNPALS